MSRVIVEYNPEISMKAKLFIRETVSPSMVSMDESTSQYAIDMCYETLQESDICFKDQEMIASLANENVHYLEF